MTEKRDAYAEARKTITKKLKGHKVAISKTIVAEAEESMQIALWIKDEQGDAVDCLLTASEALGLADVLKLEAEYIQLQTQNRKAQ